MKVPEITDVKNGIRYDTTTASLLATDNSGEDNIQEQYTYLLRGKDGRYFVAWPARWRGERDYIEPLEWEAAERIFEALPFKHVDFETAFSTKNTFEPPAGPTSQTSNAYGESGTISSLSVCLTSGDTVVIESLSLYPADRLQLAEGMLLEAKAKLGGVSSGIGFLGSPSWVVGGAILTGFLEHVATKIKASEGLEIMARAENLLQQIREQGRWFSIHRVVNIALPAPNLWFCQEDEAIGSQGLFRDKIVKQKKRFIHNGEPYFRVKLKGGSECCVVWDKVERWVGT